MFLSTATQGDPFANCWPSAVTSNRTYGLWICDRSISISEFRSIIVFMVGSFWVRYCGHLTKRDDRDIAFGALMMGCSGSFRGAIDKAEPFKARAWQAWHGLTDHGAAAFRHRLL